MFKSVPSLRILLLLIIGILFKDYFSLWLLIPIVSLSVCSLFFNKKYFVFLLGSFLILSIGGYHQEKHPFPKHFYQVGKVLKNNANNFRFTTTNHPKKIFEISKLSYLETELFVGDIFHYSGKFDSIAPPKTLEGFIYADYLESIKVDGLVKLNAFPIKTLNSSRTVQKVATKFKYWLINRILNETIITNSSKGVLIALLTGDRSFIETDFKRLFRDAGVIHVLAISGMHVGILYLLLVFILNKVFKINDKYALLIVIFTLVFYAFLTGFSSSVVRATLMLVFIQVGKVIQSKTSTLNIVFAAGWVMLVYNSEWIRDVGFQLSFSAVLGIVLVMDKFKDLTFEGNFKIFSDLIKVNFGTFLFTAPIISFHFGIINFTSVWASFLIVPLISVIMYLGIVGLVIVKVQPVTNWVFYIIEQLIFLIEKIAVFVLEFMSFSCDYWCSTYDLCFYYLALVSGLFGRKIFLYFAIVLSLVPIFISNNTELRFLNCTSFIEVKVNSKLFKLKNGDLLQGKDYFFSVSKSCDARFEILLYKGAEGFVDCFKLIESISVEKYHKLKLDY